MADFIRIPENPVPEGGEAIDFAGADGGRLRAALFAAANHRATAILMAGRSEFIEKYFEVIGDLQSRGISVATMDWRGQGLSERLLPVREKGHISDFGVFRADLVKFTEEVATKKFSGPYFLLTHSMGGTPALQMLADGYDVFSAAVLCAPMTQLFPDTGKRTAVRLLAQGACSVGASRQSVVGVKEHSLEFAGNMLTSDEARHERFKKLQEAAPNATLREPTYGWLRAAMAAFDDLHKPDRFARMKTPTLIVSAEKDDLVDTLDHAALAARSALIENVVIKGALHEIMMERNEFRNQYWDHVDRFLAPHLSI